MSKPSKRDNRIGLMTNGLAKGTTSRSGAPMPAKRGGQGKYQSASKAVPGDPATDRGSALDRARVALDAMTEDEDAAITADALLDPDNPPADELIRRRGRPALERPKEAIKLRLDAEVLDHFRASGAGWQTRMNEALRKAAKLG